MAEILPLDSVHSKPGMHSISTSLPLNQSDIHSLSSASYTSHSLSAVCEHPVAAAAEDDAIHITHLPSQPQLACADATSTPTQLNASPNLILSTSLAKLVVYLESCIPQGPHLPPSFGTLMATFHRYLTSINHAESRLARSKIISSIETRFGIPAAVSTFLMAIAGSIAGQKILAKYPHQVATCVGVIYPAWCSIRAIEHPREDDDERWLTYCKVLSAFCYTIHCIKSNFVWIYCYRVRLWCIDAF
ncbi:hypothetical protein RTP6_007433 [Batrachochytrium dendrobatidis]